MDHRRFDDAVRSLGEKNSRRTVLRGLVGGGLAAFLAAIGLGVEDADAARCGKRCKRKSGKARRRCLKKCKQAGGGGGGGTTATPQPVSTNAAGAPVGSQCAATQDCVVGSICNGGQCAVCASACPTASSSTCCAVGICDETAGTPVCLLQQ